MWKDHIACIFIKPRISLIVCKVFSCCNEELNTVTPLKTLCNFALLHFPLTWKQLSLFITKDQWLTATNQSICCRSGSSFTVWNASRLRDGTLDLFALISINLKKYLLCKYLPAGVQRGLTSPQQENCNLSLWNKGEKKKGSRVTTYWLYCHCQLIFFLAGNFTFHHYWHNFYNVFTLFQIAVYHLLCCLNHIRCLNLMGAFMVCRTFYRPNITLHAGQQCVNCAVPRLDE